MQAHNTYLSPFLGALVHSSHRLSPLIAMRFFLLGRVISALGVGTPICHFSGLSPFDPATFSAHCSRTYTTPVSYSLPLFIPLAPLTPCSRGYATLFPYFIFLFICLVLLSPLYCKSGIRLATHTTSYLCISVNKAYSHATFSLSHAMYPYVYINW